MSAELNMLVLTHTKNEDLSQSWDNAPYKQVPLDKRWDFGGWGDKRTWAILFALFFFGLALAGAAWALPHGQDASVPPIHIY